ncbi:MAG: hypothetical protein AB7S26_03605 [Sandaracinaceae bacterium]
MTGKSPLTERVVFGLLASAARMVPVPLLDDLLREKATHLMVARLLSQRGRHYASQRVKPLYADNEGCLVGVFTLMLKLALFPVRKVLAWVLAARYLAQDLARAILLGRVLDRLLADGALSSPDDAAILAEAERIRLAFDNAVRGSDLKLLQGLLGSALRSASGLPRAAMRTLMRRRHQPEDASAVEGADESDKRVLESGADKIEAALEQPAAKAFLETFDATFDENMAVLVARKPG